MSSSELYFWVFSFISVLAGFKVITSREAIYSALWLLTVFLSLAAIYLHLKAPLLAVFQVTIYAGAILVLIVFVLTLLTRPSEKLDTNQENAGFRCFGAITTVICGLLMIVCIYAITEIVKPAPIPADLGSTKSFTKYLLNDFLIHFEVVSILLLVALIGAIYIARKEKKG